MTLTHEEHAHPRALRAAIRRGTWSGPTAGLAPGHVQANLVVLPAADALDFLRFCVHNPRPCPVLEVTEVGSAEPVHTAPGADLRTDLPRYRVYREGDLVDEAEDVTGHWRDDLVAFLLGCSFTFERAMLAEGLPLRHLEQGVNVPMYRTSIACRPAGRFAGPLVVSMRPMRPDQAIRATQLSALYMPRWASRLILTVSRVRIEPIQAMSEEDAIAEGIRRLPDGSYMADDFDSETYPSAALVYAHRWSAFHSRPGTRWEDNPEVVVVDFTAERCDVARDRARSSA